MFRDGILGKMRGKTAERFGAKIRKEEGEREREKEKERGRERREREGEGEKGTAVCV